MDNAVPQSRFRIHRSTWIVGLSVLVLNALVLLPGQTVGGGSGGCREFAGDRDWVSTELIEHGWPYIFLHRSALEEEGLEGWQFWDVPWLSSSAWFDLRKQCYIEFNLQHLLLDLTILLAIVALISWAWEWRRRRSRILQFNLADLLVGFTLLALPLGWYVYYRNQEQRENRTWTEATNEFDGLDIGYDNLDVVTSRWLSGLIGDRRTPRFEFATAAKFDCGWTNESGTLEKVLPYLRAASGLQQLSVTMHETHRDSLHALVELPSLRHLWLNLWLEGEPIDLEMAQEIVQLQQLTSLKINTFHAIDKERKEFIRQRMPHCRVEFDDNEYSKPQTIHDPGITTTETPDVAPPDTAPAHSPVR